ncbi:MAG: PaaI family thioesterase [Micrococcales bacterium]|nr:PaaI family thioesterase [Micrococcales bacterium]
MSEPILSEDASLLAAKRGIGDLAQKMGIEILELSAERAVATMPVDGNTQPLGLLHGGAYLVLGETLGSFAANVWAGPEAHAVGIEISASHSKSATAGLVTGVATAISLGKTLTVHEVVVTNDKGERCSTIRITNLIRKN